MNTRKRDNAPIFTWLAYHDKVTGERQGAQEAADGRIRGYTLRADGSMEFGRWFRPNCGIDCMQTRAKERAL